MILLVPLAVLLVAVAADATTHLPALDQANSTQGLKVTGFSSVVVHKSSGPGGLTVQEPPKGWPFSEVNFNFPSKSSKEPPHSKPSETQVAAHTAPATSSLEALAKSRPPNGWHLSDVSQKITSSSNTKSVYKPTETYLASTTAPGFESHKKSSVAPLKTRHKSHQPEHDEAVEYVTLSLKNSKPKKRVPKSRYNNEPTSSFNVGYSIGFSTPPDALKPSREMLRLIGSSQQQNGDAEVVNGKPFESFTTQSHRKPRIHSGHTYKLQSDNVRPTENEEYPGSTANYYHSAGSEGHRTDGRNKYTWKNVGSNIEVSSNMEVSDNVRQHVPKRSRRPNSVRPTVYYIKQGIQQFDHEHALGQSATFHEGDAVVDVQQSGSTEKQNTVGNTALRMKDHALFVHQGESSQTKLPNTFQLGYSLNPLYPLQKPSQQESDGQEQVKNIPATVHIPKGNIPLTPYPFANGLGMNPQLAHPNAYLAGIHSGSQGTTIPALVIPMSSLAGLAGVLQGLQAGGQGGNALVQPTGGFAVSSGLLQGSNVPGGLPPSMYLGQPMPYSTVASGFKHFQMPVLMKPHTESEETIPKHHQQQPSEHQQTQHHHQHNSQHNQPQYQVVLSNTRQQPLISTEAFRTHSVIPYMHQNLNDQRSQMVKHSHIQIDPSISSKIPSYYHVNKDQALSQQIIHSGQGSSKLEFMPHGSNPSGIPLHELLKTQHGVQVFHQPTNQDHHQQNADVPSRNVKYVHSHEGASSGPHVHYITKVVQQPSVGHHMRLLPNVQYVTSKPPRQQQSLEKEQAHRDILAQQRALAAYNSMLSLTLFPQVKPTSSPVTVSSTQSSGSAYPLASSFVIDLKPPPISVARTSGGRN